MKLLFLLLLSTVCTLSSPGQTDTLPSMGAAITYEKRTDILNANKCNASEMYLKKKVKAHVATFYKDYPWIAVDFTKFKGQHGYTDKENPKRFVYPYKIEMLVHLKRKVVKEGKEGTEYVTWKYDAEYEYGTNAGRKCDFSLVPSSQITLITREVF